MVGRWLSVLALGLSLVTVPALALDRDNVRATMEQIQAYRRVALGYLQTGNVDLALVEMDRLRDLLNSVRTGRLSAQSEPALAAVLADAQTRIEQSITTAESGNLELSGMLLAQASERLDAWRQSIGLALFSDCIARVSSTYAVLDVFRKNRPNLADPATGHRIARAAAATEQELARCDAEASPEVRAEPEFRRLMDGFVASLKLVPDAIAKQDANHLYRLLIEQRAFERLLAFRFG